MKCEKKGHMTLVQNGTLYTMESDTPFRGDLLEKDGKIIEIGEHIIRTPEMHVINADGMWVFPGFIDAHSHIGISEEKIGAQGDDCNEGTNPITPWLRAIDAINPMDSAFHNALAVGITGVMVGPGSSNPIGGQFAFIKTYGRRIDDMVVLAPAALKIAFGENPKRDYGQNGDMPCTRMGIAGMIRRELFEARKYFEKEKNSSREKPMEKVFEMECYRDLFEGKIPLKAHAHRTDDIFTAIRIAKEFHVDLTLDHCTEGYLVAEELAECGFPAIVGPSFSSRSKNEVRLADFKAPELIHKAGIPVAITTDHPVSRIQYLPLCAAMAAKEGLGEMNALRAITIDAAKICRVDNRIGSLKPGKDADLAIYDGNPLDIKSNLWMTMIDGSVVWTRDQR